MKLTLNPFTLVYKNNDRYCFASFSSGSPLEYSFSDEQTAVFNRLKGGEYIEYDALCDVFTKELTDALIAGDFFCEREVDTESIYSRTNAFFSTYNMNGAREKLSGKSVLILGCGGIGTHMAWHMTTLGVGKLTILDHDTVERSNLNRQILFDTEDTGRNKIEVIREKLLKINPSMDIRTIDSYISSEEQLEKICTDEHYDLIIKALDSPAAFPSWLDSVCKKHRLTYIAGITMKENALIGPAFVPGISEAGWSDLIKLNDSSEKISGTAPSLGAVLYHISDELAVEALKLLTGFGELKYAGKIVIENIFTNKKQVISNVPEKSAEEKSAVPASSGKELYMDIILTAALTLSGIANPVMYLPAFIAAFVLPFFLYKSRTSVMKCTFINASVFSILSFVGIVRSGVLAGLTTGAVAAVSLVAAVFGALSVAILVICLMNYLICKMLKRQ